ncbi:MAG: DUF1127 domain-containing protein [Alphaproteobacteria bacterium]|nr:DUF1127 domain-containing protein [Alphaproteobacteria bacterium]MCY4607234.1 DUF1127 domain-containing protein [bacterium]
MSGLLDHIRHAWNVRRTRRQLATLSDEQLRDIGIERDQVARLVRSLPRRTPLTGP